MIDLARKARVTYQRYMDKSVPHKALRWSCFAFLTFLFVARIVSYGGFYVIAYGLFIHMLAQAVMMVTPLYDPEESRGGDLPTTNAKGDERDDEFRPFVPVVQEFVVWKSVAKGVFISLLLTVIPLLDIPVYWPILVLYSIVLLAVNMGAKVKHMWQHGYVPWSAGKPKFVPKNNV